MTAPQDLPDARVEAVADTLYALLPAHVHLADEAAGGPLRALCGVLALPSAEIDAETDAYYDALFVETAGPAALEAIAALVAATPLRPMPPGSDLDQRAYVANTVRYRRGKGTARVIEALAADVTGLGAVAVEYFMRLARCGDVLDLRPDRPGTARLVDGTTAARAGSAFDVLPRLLDVRPVVRTHRDRPAGRHGVAAMGVHVVRPAVLSFAAPSELTPEKLAGVPVTRPWTVGGVDRPGYHQLAARPGARIRLFAPDRRADAGGGRLLARDLPDRLQRLPLHRETDELRRAHVGKRPSRLPDRPWFDDAGAPFTVFLLREGATRFERVPPAQLRIANLEDPPAAAGVRPPAELTYPGRGPDETGQHPIACAIDPVTGRIVVAAPPAGAADVVEVRVAHGTGHGRAIGAGAADRGNPDLPFEIRDSGAAADLVWIVDPVSPAGGAAAQEGRVVSTLQAALAEVAIHGAGRRSLVLLTRCDIERSSGSGRVELELPPDSELHLVAAAWQRPQRSAGVPADPSLRGFVVRRARRFTIDAPLRVIRGAGVGGVRAGRLVIDGLELTRGMVLASGSVAELDLRHATVRHRERIAIRSTGALSAVRITVNSSICGPVRLGTGSATVTGDLEVRGSVLDTDGAAGDALRAPGLDCSLRQVSVLGRSSMRELTATDVIFTEPVAVTRRQSGCVRHSFVPAGSATPRSFRCQPALAVDEAVAEKGRPLTPDEMTAARLSVHPVLMDVSADEPTYAMLHPLCPDAIRSGGDGECEMGAFAVAALGIATANLVSLFDDYLPVALDAGVIDDTRSAAVAHRRNVP